MIYMLHFERPLAHARHYTGFVEREDGLEKRLKEHRSGRGARIMEVCKERGIGFELARTWEGSRHDERRIKNMKCAPRLCPICQAGAAQKRKEA